ncbi:MAG: hypothetical protein JOZ16_15785 [Methylobacteriaceae bacterium]|nr:hypothetical protein [Methylobacteriaceae bacterium]
MADTRGPHPLCQKPEACQSKGKGLCRSCNIKRVTAVIGADAVLKDVRRKRNLSNLDKYRADPAWRERQRQKLARLHKDEKFADAHRARSSALLRDMNLSPRFQEIKRAKREEQKPKTRTSIPEATKELLAAQKRPMSNTEIAEHLKAWGMKISNVDPNNTIGSIITRRSNKVGDIVRMGKGIWGLPEWNSTSN